MFHLHELFIKPKKERLIESIGNVSVKEFGASNFVLGMNEDIKESLKDIYPDKWEELFLFSVFRLLYNTPIKNQYRMGTIAVISDLEERGERIYNLLKSRVEIEVMFDAFKNVLNADRTYMRDDYQMEGWAFINFIALVFYYRLYRILADNSLLKRYTPNDVLIHLSRIYKLKIQNEWITSEIPKKTRVILEKLNIPIT